MKSRLLILIILFLVYHLLSFAEVSAVKDSNNNYSSLISMYKDFPYNETWEKYNTSSNRTSLNENGDIEGDGKPSIFINPISKLPEVTWADFDGSDYEIVCSSFNGIEWTSHELLTNDIVNDLDPFLSFSAEGNARIVWWSDDSLPQVYYSVRKANGWTPKLRISNPAETSKYPSFAAITNWILFSFEVLDPPLKNIVVVHGEDDPDPHPTFKTTIGYSDFSPNSQPTSHYENGHIWVDWIYDENYLAWSEKIGEQWTPQRYEIYSSSEDIPRARLYIKMKVINNQ